MSFFAFSGLVNGLVCSGLGLFVFSRSPQNPKHRTYGFYCLCLAIWGFGYYAWQIAGTQDTALTALRILMAGAILIPITHLHHVLTLLNLADSHRRFLLTGYLVSGLLVLSNFTSAMVSGVGPRLGFAYWPNPGWVFPAYLLTFLVSIGYAAWLFFRAYRRIHGTRRRQYLYLLCGSLIGYGGGATNFPLWYGLPLLPLGTILVSLYVGIVAYALVRYRMLDFSVAVEKGLTFLLLGLGISLPALLLALVAQRAYFGRISLQFSLVLLLIFLLVAALAYQVMDKAQSAVAKTLFRNRHDMYETLKKFSKSLVRNLHLKTLTQQIVNTLGTVMGIRTVVLYLYDMERNEFIPNSLHGPSGPMRSVVGAPATAVLLERLRPPASVVVPEELERTEHSPTTMLLRDTLVTLGAEVCLPLTTPHRILGFCTLSQRHNQAPYSSQDLDLLMTLSQEAAIAIDNAMLYEELKRSQALVHRTDRLRSLETIAGGLAHEIRNPLTSIKAFVDLAPERVNDEEFLTRFSKVVREDVARIERLTKEILDYARPSEPNLRVEDLNEIVTSCLYALRLRPMHMRITIETDLTHGLPPIRADRQQIKQVLLNLFLNAEEAMQHQGGVLSVSTRLLHKSAEDSWVQLEVRDTGAGIAPVDLDHIFDPFFTTKHFSQEYEGTGLGLAIAHQIVREHRGMIEVQSEVGHGSTFFVNLPAHREGVPSPPLSRPWARQEEMSGTNPYPQKT